MIKALSYIGFRSPSFEEWATFGPEVLGAQLAPRGADDAVRLRVDVAEARITVHPGERDEVAYLGWDVGDQAGLEAATAGIRRRRHARRPRPSCRRGATRRRARRVRRPVRLPPRADVRPGRRRSVRARATDLRVRHRRGRARPRRADRARPRPAAHAVLRRASASRCRTRSTRACRSRSCTATRATTRWPSPAGAASSASTT